VIHAGQLHRNRVIAAFARQALNVLDYRGLRFEPAERRYSSSVLRTLRGKGSRFPVRLTAVIKQERFGTQTRPQAIDPAIN
jgi:hypothetical protein